MTNPQISETTLTGLSVLKPWNKIAEAAIVAVVKQTKYMGFTLYISSCYYVAFSHTFFTQTHLHVRRELFQCFVKIIHLSNNTNNNNKAKGIG